MGTLETRNLSPRPTPAFPFRRAQKAVLSTWSISLVFVNTRTAKSLNQSMRKKSYVPNVLSYATGKRSGEVIICPDIARVEAPSYELSYTKFIGLLFIHALFHLKGMRHGSTMETAERQVLARIASINEKTHRSRSRHRHVPGKGRRRRGG